MQDDWYSRRLQREIAARPGMARAVGTPPSDALLFPAARDLLSQALARGQQQDDLLLVLQQVRLSVETYAIRIGLSPHALGETTEPTSHLRRRGHFEHDVVHSYLPAYLAGAATLEITVCFKVHAHRAYRDVLRQRIRRDRDRAEHTRWAPTDPRTCHELHAQDADGSEVTVVSPAYLAQWVPSPGEVYEATTLCSELERLLDPFDYQIAELLMTSQIVQGDKREIARSLSVHESKISRAITNIKDALRLLRRRRELL